MRPYILNWIKNQGGSPAPSEYNAKSSTEISYVVGQIRAEKALQLVEELPAELTIASGAIFRSIMQSFFEGMTALKSLPYIDTTGQTNFYHLANSCPLLENVPAYNTASITNVNGLNGMFTNCNKLTNESLNNIMQMCINAVNYPGTKTLKFVGLTQAQATTCQSLSNWDAFVAAGWTTGY